MWRKKKYPIHLTTLNVDCVCVCVFVRLLLLDRWLWFYRQIDRCDRCDCAPLCGFSWVCAYTRHISPIFSARIRSLVYAHIFFSCLKNGASLFVRFWSFICRPFLSIRNVQPEIYMQSIDNWHIVYQAFKYVQNQRMQYNLHQSE